MRPFHRCSAALALAALTVFLYGCGPSAGDKVREYQSRYAGLRAAFAAISRLLPAEASEGDPAGLGGLDPKPVYDEIAAAFNTEIVMDWQLSDPNETSDQGDRFNLLLSKDLQESLLWTGPRSPLNDSLLSGRSKPELVRTLENGLAYRYLAVNRILSHSPPKAVDERSFHSGSISLRCFLADLKGPKILGSFDYQAVTRPRVEYVYKTNEDDPKERLEKWAASSMWENARRELFRLLAERTNGTFRLKD
jgi:hypothetical protein